MQLLFHFSYYKLNYLVLFLAFLSIGNVRTDANDTSQLPQTDNKAPVIALEQKSVKKELREKLDDKAIVEIKDHTDKSTVTEKTVKGPATQEINQKVDEKTDISESATKTKPLEPQHNQHILDEDFVLQDDDSITESLKTGFYFLLALSSVGIGFILFRIYRLRLSRAERRYGVQGDRSAQELTPLPTAVEDAQSDDDQTLFEVQRQNIRIL